MTLSVRDNLLRCFKKFGATARPPSATAKWQHRPLAKAPTGRDTKQADPGPASPAPTRQAS
jgi:hypothetical protein